MCVVSADRLLPAAEPALLLLATLLLPLLDRLLAARAPAWPAWAAAAGDCCWCWCWCDFFLLLVDSFRLRVWIPSFFMVIGLTAWRRFWGELLLVADRVFGWSLYWRAGRLYRIGPEVRGQGARLARTTNCNIRFIIVQEELL